MEYIVKNFNRSNGVGVDTDFETIDVAMSHCRMVWAHLVGKERYSTDCYVIKTAHPDKDDPLHDSGDVVYLPYSDGDINAALSDWFAGPRKMLRNMFARAIGETSCISIIVEQTACGFQPSWDAVDMHSFDSDEQLDKVIDNATDAIKRALADLGVKVGPQ